MTLNFVLGTSQKDHQDQLIKKFVADYKDNPQDKFFFIVPNHIKFESEIEIIKQFKQAFRPEEEIVATSNLQIFSLSRLAWYFLRDEDVLNRQTLTSTKKSMIVRSILNNRADSLRIFKGEVRHNGFIDEMTKQLDDLQSGQVDVEDLDNIINNLDSSFEIQKMTELRTIYGDYQTFINENYLHNDLLTEKLIESFQNEVILKNTHFYFNGFSTFKSSEYTLLNTIAQKSDLTVSLELDPNDNETLEPGDYYYRSKRTYKRLADSAKAQKVAITTSVADKNRVEPDIRALEDFWIASNSINKPIKKVLLNEKSSVQIWQSTDRQTEIQAVATYIRQLVAKNEDYRFKDFLILSRDLSGYESFIKPIFDTSEVPMFFDLQNNMAQHPLKLLIDYLFQFAKGNLMHESIFQMLKLNLMHPKEVIDDDYFTSAIDLAENYSLAHGLFKKDWLDTDDFVSEVDVESIKDEELKITTITNFEKINYIKHFVATTYGELTDMIDNSTNNEAMISHLYNFIEQYRVFETLRNWQNTDTENNNMLNADRPEQVVSVFNQLLSEFVEIFGDEQFNIDDFLQVLDSGFSQSQYSQIPSTLDAVNISELGMVQMNNRKITIILGSTAELMPKSNKNNSLISDEEKQNYTQYLKNDSEFADNAEIINNDEPFIHGTAFTSSSQRIIFTYPLMSGNDQEQASPYLQRIQDHFNISPQIITNTPKSEDEKALQYVGSVNSTLNYLIRLNRSLRNTGAQMSADWQFIQETLFNNLELKKKLDSALNYQNNVANLMPEVAHQLYGDNLNVSISQLETFYTNELEYFLQYGLKLRERDVFELTPATLGSFFHDNLDEFVKYLRTNQIDLSKIDHNQVQEIIAQVLKDTIQKPANRLFSSTEQMKYITKELSSTLSGLMMSINNQSELLNFNPYQSEVTFGSIRGATGIPGITYNLDDGKKINVRGKIDRIDKFNTTNSMQIIDYKSSERKMDYTKFNSGIQMQLTTYIQAAMNDLAQIDAKNVVGAYYSEIKNPRFSATYIPKNHSNQYKLRGIVLDEGNNIDQLAPNDKNKSDIFVLKSDRVSPRELELILDYNKQLILNAAKTIYSGELKLNPFRISDSDHGLKFTNFKPIFEFDAMLPENNYHELPSISKMNLLEKISQEGGEDNA